MFSSSLLRKLVMALSGLFLISFLALHLAINLASVFSVELYNEWSHFMGYNKIVQLLLQPILVAGVVVHFVMGFVLEIQNRKARGAQGYAVKGGSTNSSWLSRNMILSGAVVLAFIGLHMYDFWLHEMTYKYVEQLPVDTERYHEFTVAKFSTIARTAIYSLSFVLLAMHLYHGFASSMQTIGLDNKYGKAIQAFAKVFAIAVPAGFIFIALYHHLNPLQ
jgi:succinate dehydrogenase / fumarate reductase cytochrome b subunit